MGVQFDSLGFVRRLEDAGVERKVAEAHADTAREYILAEVATSEDFRDLKRDLEAGLKSLTIDNDMTRQRLDSELAKVRQEFQLGLRDLEQKLTIRLGGMLVVAVGVLVALERFLA
ncbi:MAG: hypothetical protein AAF618_01855 [Pseudomonadota bacterium]